MPNLQLFVTTDEALDTGTATYTDPSQVDDGAFAVLDSEDSSSGSEDLTGTDAPDKLTLVRGGEYPQIEHIEKDHINSVQTQDYRAEVQQVSAVGFSGSGTNTISSDVGSATIKVTRLEKGYEPFPRLSATYGVKNGDDPYTIAAELAKQLNAQSVDNVFGSDTRGFIDADVLSDVTTTETDDSGGSAVTATVVNGSAIIEYSAAPDTLTVGGQVRIGSAADNSDPVYVVEDIDGTTVTLDRPYAGESDSGVATGDSSDSIASDDNIGVELTAIESTGGDPAISFQTSLDGTLEDDPVTSIETPQTASGSTAEVKNIEEFTWGTRGYYYTNYFPQEPDSHVVAGTNYDILTIIYKNNNDKAVVSKNEWREIHIAYPEGNVDLSTLQAFFQS